MNNYEFGIFSALAIHDTGSVIGSALQFSDNSVEVAISLKILRTLWLIPLIVFELNTSEKEFKSIKKFEELFKDYGMNNFFLGGSGADIGPLKDGLVILAGLRPDSQRYFDVHHAASDTFDKINKRELELGAATMASMIMLIDKYIPTP